jgi:spore photoproduct lyase
MSKLQEQGWQLGLRFDPIIFQHNYKEQYQSLFEQVFSRIPVNSIHSVSLGVFRLPEKYFKKIHKLYPQEKLFASPLETKNKMTSYKADLEQDMLHYCSELLLNYIPQSKFFPCTL